MAALESTRLLNGVDDNNIILAPFFHGSTMLKGETLKQTFTRKGISEVRETTLNNKIACYRNLNVKGMYSMRQCKGNDKGKITGLARTIVIEHPQLSISLAGRNRCLSLKQKNVHATIIGEFKGCFDVPADVSLVPDPVCASYAPYFSPTFFICHQSSFGTKVEYERDLQQRDIKRFAIISLNGVIFSDLN